MSDEYRDFLEATKTPSEEFEDMYGFAHDCHCAEDWENGACGVVSECFMKLADDALDTCFKAKGKAAEDKRTIERLTKQLEALGAEPVV